MQLNNNYMHNAYWCILVHMVVHVW
jgi:hypothetical protein